MLVLSGPYIFCNTPKLLRRFDREDSFMVAHHVDNQQPKCHIEAIGMILLFTVACYPNPQPQRRGFGNQPSNRENHPNTAAALRRISEAGPIGVLGLGVVSSSRAAVGFRV